MEDRRAGLLLGVVLAVVTASLLAAVAMPAPHTGGDNAAYLSLAQSLATGNGYTELWDPLTPPHTKYPPGFPLFLSVLIIAGVSGWAWFKVASAALILGAVLLVYAWASRRVGLLAGGAIAFTTLCAAGWLQASRWILSEPLFLLLLFLTLWALEPRGAPARGDTSGEEGRGRGGQKEDHVGRLRTVVGCTSAGLALFTRTAGLPLVVALLAALLLAGRRRAAAFFAAGLAAPGLWWLSRAMRGGQGAYQSEFWLVDPYQPDLGSVGLLDLPVRVMRNLGTYVGRVVPSEWWGAQVPFATPTARWALGLVLVGLALWGWLLRARRRPGTPEIFVPLYVGLILVWPETWAGDRFSLPLYPLILLYAGSALESLWVTRGRGLRAALLTVAFLALVGPAARGWLVLSEQSSACRRVAAREDPAVCNAVPFRELGVAAAWMGRNLPADAVVFTRKPRMFYLMGGPRGRTFPFTRNPDRFLEEADRIGARWVVLDRLDGISAFYLPPVISGRPDAFCHVGGWSEGGAELGTELFGILPESEREGASDIVVCPGVFGSWPGQDPPTYHGEVPRLAQGPLEPMPESLPASLPALP